MKVILTILLGVLAPLSSAYALIYNVPYNDEIALRQAILKANDDPDGESIIRFFTSPDPSVPFVITEKLPVITSKNLRFDVAEEFTFRPAGGYTGSFLELGEGSSLILNGFNISGFSTAQETSGVFVGPNARLEAGYMTFSGMSSMGNGGAVNCSGPGSECEIQDSIFDGNHSDGSGGALFCGPGSQCVCEDCEFESNHADVNGGIFSCQSGASCDFVRPVGKDNSASVFGCNGDNLGGNARVRGGAFSQPGNACIVVGNESPFGRFEFVDGFELPGEGQDIIDCTRGPGAGEGCLIFNFVLDQDPGEIPGIQIMSTQKSSIQSQCNDFGSGAITSLGFNIDRDGSCFLNQVTDLPSTDPMVEIDDDGIPQPLTGSPLIESGPVDFVNNELPCLYKDLNGLGRPQDFDLDGEFACDRGPVEIQGGSDIGAPQSAAFYDTGRDGEGVFVEILEDDLAVASFYTYAPDGNGLLWILGIGQVVGNSVVIDDMLSVTGGVFGDDFDQEKIVETPVGGMSLVFPDCDAGVNPGRLNFTAREDSGLENLLQEATRLTNIVSCDDTPLAANARLSGAFFASERSGEGIFVQWLSDGTAVFVFYTFDTEGNPLWIISDPEETVINGSTVTAGMLYAESTTRFGSNFNADEVTLASWGTITLTYSDDDNLSFAYDSSLVGYGSGNHAYTRLTNLVGTRTESAPQK